MTIYLFNQSGSGNIGDQLIGLVVSSLLSKIGCDVIHNRLHPVITGKLDGLKIHLWSYTNDVKQVFTADALVIGGGNLIMDVTSVGVRWAVHHFWLSILSLLFGKRYYYLCVGATPLRTALGRLLYRFALKFADGISVRDQSSQEYVQQLTGRQDVELMFDPALLVASLYPQDAVVKEGSVGICPVQLYPSICADLSIYQKYVDMISRLIRHYTEKGNKVYLFLNDANVDRKVFLDIIDSVPREISGFHAVEGFPGIQDYLPFIAGLSFLISSRMHAVICATSYGVPSIGLGWQPKMQSFFLDQGLTGHINIVQRFEQGAAVEDAFQETIRLEAAKSREIIKLEPPSLDLRRFLEI